jgi:hypothetical protein
VPLDGELCHAVEQRSICCPVTILTELSRFYELWLFVGLSRGLSSSPDRIENIVFSTSARPAASYPMGTEGSFSGVKRPERETDTCE